MITERVNNLFKFIEFLHSNIGNFNQYNQVINEMYILDEQRNELSPSMNFKDKLKDNELLAEIEDKEKLIDEKIIQVIQDKVIELNICDWDNPVAIGNWNRSDIHKLKTTSSEEDITEILQHKSKYIEFRTVTNCTYFKDFFFSELDKTLKKLFVFFDQTTENEFKVFESKPIKVTFFNQPQPQLEALSEFVDEHQEEKEGTQPEGEEPTNKIKGWIVYFEKDVNKTDTSNFDQIFKKRDWKKGKKVVKNDFHLFKSFAINKKCDGIYKKSLQIAIDMLRGEEKKKAEKLYLELK